MNHEEQFMRPLASNPSPHPSSRLRSTLIVAYSTGFLFWLVPWLDSATSWFRLRLGTVWLVCAVGHFTILQQRQPLFRWLSRLLGGPIRLFEFPFFVMNLAWYAFILLVAPAAFGLRSGLHSSLLPERDASQTMYLLFAGGSSLVVAAVSGFDVYPVNTFTSRRAVEQLISITKDLMRLSNTVLVLVTGSVLLGEVIGRVQLSTPVIYVALYAVVGFALGSTVVLGQRLTDLIYRLDAFEIDRPLVRLARKVRPVTPSQGPPSQG